MTAALVKLAGRRVLVVEDEAMVAMMLEAMLAHLGCVVVDVAGTVARGMTLAADPDLDIDAALLDVNLGGEKVYPLAERLTAGRVPFAFCTGYGRVGLAPGFDDVLTLSKPFSITGLEKTLKSLLGTRSKEAIRLT